MLALQLALAASLPMASVAAAASSPASMERTLIALEKQSWAAWQKKDVSFWKRHLSADHIELDGPNGPQDRNYVINGVASRKCDVASYSLDQFTFRKLGPGAAVLVYHASQEFLCGEKRIPNAGWVSSLYQQRRGRWQNVLFEHLVVSTPAPRP